MISTDAPETLGPTTLTVTSLLPASTLKSLCAWPSTFTVTEAALARRRSNVNTSVVDPAASVLTASVVRPASSVNGIAGPPSAGNRVRNSSSPSMLLWSIELPAAGWNWICRSGWLRRSRTLISPSANGPASSARGPTGVVPSTTRKLVRTGRLTWSAWSEKAPGSNSTWTTPVSSSATASARSE